MTVERWGCPEWRDASAYPQSGEALDDHGWKWEFLRRLPSYRAAWLRGENSPEATDACKRSRLTRLFDPSDRSPWKRCDIDCFEIKEGWFRLPIYLGEENCFFESHGVAETDEARLAFLLEYLRNIGLIGCYGTPDDPPQHGDRFLHFRVDLEKPLHRQADRFQENMKHWIREFRGPENLNLTFDKFADQARQSHPNISQEEINKLWEWAIESEIQVPLGKRLYGKDREKWPRHLRVIDAKDQGAAHQEVYDQYVGEWTDGNDALTDDYYRKGDYRARVSQWHKQAVGVMQKTADFL